MLENPFFLLLEELVVGQVFILEISFLLLALFLLEYFGVSLILFKLVDKASLFNLILLKIDVFKSIIHLSNFNYSFLIKMPKASDW